MKTFHKALVLFSKLPASARRRRSRRLFLRLTVVVVYAGGSVSAFAQGSLTPPPGTPAPTFKTLQQVEPRIDLQNAPGAAVDTSNANSHFIINQPGSYYLSANLEVTKANGITIVAAGVTLDLNGFAILRTSGSPGTGIFVDTGAEQSTIQNGSIKGFGGGVTTSTTTTRGCAYRNLSATACALAFQAPTGSIVESCRAFGNTGTGIFVFDGSTISNCAANQNGGTGIAAGTGCRIVNCTAVSNRDGIVAGSNCTLSHCTARANSSSTATSAGISTGTGSTITNCTSAGNVSTNATPTGSTGAGFSISFSSLVEGCTAEGNMGDGFRISSGTQVRGNTATSNGLNGDGAGIHVTGVENRIENNNVTSCDRGIDVDSAGNLIIKNSARSNGSSSAGNYDIVANNRYGPIIDDSATGAAAAAGKGPLTSTLTTTDPWANFSY